MNFPATHEQAYALYAPYFREQYRAKSRAACESAIEDINETLRCHERNAYTGKLYAELDAARDRLAAYRNKSRAALRLAVNA
jgi:NAD-specific glutamate dehydrogenase